MKAAVQLGVRQRSVLQGHVNGAADALDEPGQRSGRGLKQVPSDHRPFAVRTDAAVLA